ncbi:hypothetical protein NWF34_10910 [Gordonia sp. GONU]|uniref:COG4705 family protein n=1 Tax=Gordonia sp. GONU TaxID=2972949 RepID=UPI0021AC7809|nr:hypothetical protein [Gordonia sp. GONU]MCR8897457.1 hypothetical protein [Gordonia sp. GONU]
MDSDILGSSSTRLAMSKVPEVTVYFWIIKILATTVGETAADYVNMTLGLGLQSTTVVAVILLVVTLVAQFTSTRYLPALYWWTVLLVSVTGTLITDNLTDNLGVPLMATTIVFALALVAVFATWYAFERTLSIHSIRTGRREAFYWLAILTTFALGTASGDLVAEKLALGYLTSLIIFTVVIAVVTAAHYLFKLNMVVAFWAAYVVTRPLGASLGDLLTQPRDDGGLGLSTTATNLVFLAVMVLLVGYLSLTKIDRLEQRDVSHASHNSTGPAPADPR